MTISLQNQVVVITGGAVRLGRSIALECARAGASVAITYNNSEQEALKTVAEMQAVAAQDLLAAPGRGRQFAAFRADVTRASEIDRLATEVLQTFGTVTALVNNAAIFRRTPFESLQEADFDDHIATNLKGPFLACKRFSDIFLDTGSGSIVNIADIHGLQPLKNYVPYCISKAGVIMLTQTLALALAPTVRVNCLCPGTILPPSEKQGEDDEVQALIKRIPAARLGTAEEVAETVVFLLGGPPFLNGVVLPLDGAERLR